MDNVLEIRDLHVGYGRQTVLRGLDLRVPRGSVFGFVGRNGAGKTTCMKSVLGLLRAQKGEILICGETVKYGRSATNRFVGYLQDVPEFYPYMSAREYLRLCGEISDMDGQSIRTRSEELLRLVGLQDVKSRIGGYSRGMKQRLGIAQALLHQPQLLLCDEPTSALDPLGRKEVLGILSHISEKTTVLFSTHILSDAERICDRVAILENGVSALSGTITELKSARRQDRIHIEFSNPAETKRIAVYMAGLEGVTVAEKDAEAEIRTKDLAKTGAELLAFCSREKLLPQRMELAEPTLEDLFLSAVGEKGETAS